MIIRTIEMLLEYLCIVLCLYKVTKVRFKFNPWLVWIFIIELIIFEFSDINKIPMYGNLVVAVLQLLFTKFYLRKSWKSAITAYGMTLILIMLLQMLWYYFLRLLTDDIKVILSSGILVNGAILLMICIGKGKYINYIIKKLSVIKTEVIISMFVIIVFRIVYLCWDDKMVDVEMAIQFLVETLCVCGVSALWFNAESEKELKKKELQMYDTYNKAFEETINTIRIRQHEFENHIHAIRSLNYTIKDMKELSRMQEEYCNRVLEENKLNKLLKQNLNPVIIGFLYSKITNAEETGVKVACRVTPVNVADKIEIYEFIEILGILFDNAVEALKETEDKRIILKLMQDEENIIFLEIANRSREYRNEELEKFCMRGYSSKGKNRGVGLTRVKEIVERNKAELLIRNVIIDDNNYLSFKIYIGNK